MRPHIQCFYTHYLMLFILCATFKEYIFEDTFRHDEQVSLFGDLGDEVHTNYPIRKSNIPNIVDDSKKQNLKDHTNSNSALQVQMERLINPLFYRDFIHTKNYMSTHELSKKSDINKRNDVTPLSVNEIIALNKIKQMIDPNSAHIIEAANDKPIIEPNSAYIEATNGKQIIEPNSAHIIEGANGKRNQLSRDQAVRLAKSLRSGKTPQSNMEMRIEAMSRGVSVNLNKYNAPVASRFAIADSTSRQITSVPFNNKPAVKSFNSFIKIPLKIATAVNNVLGRKKQDVQDSVFYRSKQVPYNSNFRESKRAWKGFASSAKNGGKNDYNLLSSKYRNNSLLNDLSKVTMKWTGYKAIDAIKQGSSAPTWMTFLKGAMQPKVVIKDEHHSKQLKSVKKLQDPKKSKSLSLKKESNIIPDVSRKILGISAEKRKIKAAQMKKKKDEEEDENKENEEDIDSPQEVINVTVSRPPPQPYQYPPYQPYQYQYFQPQQPQPPPLQQPQSPPMQQPQSPPLQQPQQVFIPQPGVIPWNYNHAEKLPDGRIRPALYPIAKHIPTGKCLPESSLCDKGHDEQCCGAATFCVDFWGISKCLAFRRQSLDDLHNLYQIRNNINYKNYHRYLTSSIFDNIKDASD
ncbi:uncharacterized protein LOC130641859 [Hydractinia symbiolongicarpus]|uniref:uncharacterized protein LOC130641859 n=1 Tax=Hydractinia symbiolongicarpus TaxID=13093 RepID=UPI00254B388F|nr:uncharacterized protein LOC130641859 [Hydractinia symbiolongicarpus]